MSFIEEKFIGVQCDNCREFAENSDGGAFFSDEETARDNAVNGEEWHEEAGKHYCKNCYSFNDNDELIIDETKFVDSVNEKKDGWIKIESEADLPTESYVYWTLRRGFKYPMFKYVEVFTEEEKAYWLETYEYYQSIKKPDLPLT